MKLRNPFKPQVITNCQGEPYLVRWRLIWTNRFSLYLHHILRSDEDRELHDHPWSFVSVMLWGGYTEITKVPGGEVHTPYRAPKILFRPQPWAHRLLLTRPVWTLVFVGPRRRWWGFHTPTGWVHWKDFLRAKGCGETDGQP